MRELDSEHRSKAQFPEAFPNYMFWEGRLAGKNWPRWWQLGQQNQQIHQESLDNYGLQVKSGPPPVFVNEVYGDTAMLNGLGIVEGAFTLQQQ